MTTSTDQTDPTDQDETPNPPSSEGRVVDVTLQLRLPANHPVVTEDFVFANVTIGEHYSFTLERHVPLRPVGERTFLADYSDDWGPDGYQL